MRNPFYRKTLPSFLLLFVLMATSGMAQTDEVVIVDSNFQNLGGIMASLQVGTPHIEATENGSFQHVLEQALVLNPNVKIIHLFAPTHSGSISIGNRNYTTEAVNESLDKAVFAAHGAITLLVYSCSLANNQNGVELLQSIASRTNFNVASYASCVSLDNKLDFDFSTKPLKVSSTLFE